MLRRTNLEIGVAAVRRRGHVEQVGHHGHHARGASGPGIGRWGTLGRGVGPGGYLDRDLTVTDIKEILEHRPHHHYNQRLRLGKVEAQDDDWVTAEIVTVDGSLAERIEVDRHTGRTRRVP